MNTFDHKVVDGFIRSMERNGVGLATQSNAYDKLKAILLDAHRLGLYSDIPSTASSPPVHPRACGDPLCPTARSHTEGR